MTDIYGIKVSNVGKDVKTCDDIDLVMSSEISTLKTFSSYDATVNCDPLEHNLGYIPIHLYVGVLPAKSSITNLVGQNTEDISTNIVVTTTEIRNDSNYSWAADALVYVFYDEL